MDEILVKYLLEEASPEEASIAHNWLKAHPDNQRRFDQFKLIWTESKKLEQETPVDEQEAWSRFQERIRQSEAKAVPLPKRNRARLFRAAAAILVLLAGTWVTYFALTGREVVLAAGDRIRTETLPDGSVITLNKQATLTYAQNFNRKNRQVALKGEAFFDVTPNTGKPFNIKVADVSVTVVGTSFNIRNTEEATEVVVETGVVVVAKNHNQVKLLPQQKAIVLKNSNQPVVASNEDDLYQYYRTNKLVCNNTPLWKVVEMLNRTSATRIEIGDRRIANLSLTTTFENASLNDILNTIAATFNIQVEQKDSVVILK